MSYSGDNNFQGSSSAALSQTVNQGATSTTVTSSANPSVFGQSVTFTTTVAASAPAAGTPTGTVTFLDGGVSIGTGTLAGGTATFTTAALSLATHTITVSYSGDNNFQGSSSAALSQTVNQGATSTTVTSSANPSVFGQSVTFTTTVAASAPAAGTPTGTVTFLDGGVSIGTGTLAGGTATFTTAALSLATHTITVSYSGDNNFQGSSSAALSQTVNQGATSTTVTSSANPSVFGQSVTFTATVAASAPAAGTPTGTVTFLDGGVSIGTGTLAGGTATITTSSLSVATHTITVSYSGDSNFQGSSSPALSQMVQQGATSATVTSGTNPSVFGQSVTFTATVAASAPAAGTPTGTVTFLDGGVSIGTGTLSSDTATFTTSSLSVAAHTITVSYSGDSNFQPSSSAALSQTVNQGATATTVTSAVNSSVFGQSVTFTAQVSVASPAAGTLTGTVTFLDGGVSIGTGILSGGSTTFTTASLSAAAHTITVTYNGDGNFAPSTSANLLQTVNPANTTTIVTSSLNPSVYGQSVTFTAAVSANAPSTAIVTAGTVQFLVDGVDFGSPVSVNNSGVAVSNPTGSTQLSVGAHTITASYSGGSNFNSSTFASYSASVLSESPTAYYQLNEASGATAQDDSGHGSNATYNGGVSLGVPGPIPGSTAVQLDGSTGYVSLPSAPFGNYPTGGSTTNYALTFETWFNAPAGSNGGVILGQTGAGYVPAVMLGTDGRIRSSMFWLGSGSDVITSLSTYNDGHWHLLDSTYANGTQSLYIDNVLIGTQNFAETAYSGSYSYTLGTGNTAGWTGGNGGQFYFNGRLAQAAIYPAALSASQIAAHYDAQDGLVQTVISPTTTLVSSSASTSAFGQSVTLTATVSATAPGAGTPDGMVTFLDSITTLGTVSLSGGTSSLTISALAVGNHTITVSYAGGSLFAASTTAAFTQTVDRRTPRRRSLPHRIHRRLASPSPLPRPSRPQFAGTATGMVTFLDGTATLGTASLSGGVASFTTNALPIGNDAITASYGGDGNYTASTSAALVQSVLAATTTTLSSSANPLAFGQSATFTATVSANAPFNGSGHYRDSTVPDRRRRFRHAGERQWQRHRRQQSDRNDAVVTGGPHYLGRLQRRFDLRR